METELKLAIITCFVTLGMIITIGVLEARKNREGSVKLEIITTNFHKITCSIPSKKWQNFLKEKKQAENSEDYQRSYRHGLCPYINALEKELGVKIMSVERLK